MMHNQGESKEIKDNANDEHEESKLEMVDLDFEPPPPSSLPSSASLDLAMNIHEATSFDEARKLQLDRLQNKYGLIEPLLEKLRLVDSNTFKKMHQLIIKLMEIQTQRTCQILTPEIQLKIAEEIHSGNTIARMSVYFVLAHSGFDEKVIKEIDLLPLTYVMQSIEEIMMPKVEVLKEEIMGSKVLKPTVSVGYNPNIDNDKLYFRITPTELRTILSSPIKEQIKKSDAKVLLPEITNIITDFAINFETDKTEKKKKHAAKKELKIDELPKYLKSDIEFASPSVSQEQDRRLLQRSVSSFLRETRQDKKTKPKETAEKKPHRTP